MEDNRNTTEKEKKTATAMESTTSFASYLSEDVLEDIQIRLPFESLMRFKCVSRSFCAQITNPRFQSHYLSYHKHILLKYNKSSYSDCQTKLVLLSTTSESHRFSVAQLDLPPNTSFKQCRIFPKQFSLAGHCNGVICLCCPSFGRNCGSVMLYNLTTRQFNIVPQPSSFDSYRQNHSCSLNIGFGYDPRTNDFALIMISSIRSLGRNLDSFMFIEEYSLSTNSWRILKRCDDQFYSVNSFGIYLNGFYYWLARTIPSHSLQNVLLILDAKEESLYTVKLPEIELRCDTQIRLSVLHETVALLCYNSVGRFDIWAMNSSGIGITSENTWEIVRSVEYQDPIPGPVEAMFVPWKCNEILVGFHTGRLMFYDLDTEQMKVVSDCGLSVNYGSHCALSYVNSTISVKGGN